MTVILIFIIILNIVSIVLMYYTLADIEKKEKLIFIAAGTAIMYMLTSIVYWISTRNIEMTQVSETGKDLIVFLFVPINGIIVLPLFAKSYYKFTAGTLDGKFLRNRGVILAVILLIILIIECMYFKNIQEQVVNLIMERQNTTQEQESNITNQTEGNTLEDIENITENNQIVNNDIQEVQSENVTNDVTSNTVQENNEDSENVVSGSNATVNNEV